MVEQLARHLNFIFVEVHESGNRGHPGVMYQCPILRTNTQEFQLQERLQRGRQRQHDD